MSALSRLSLYQPITTLYESIIYYTLIEQWIRMSKNMDRNLGIRRHALNNYTCIFAF